MSIYKYYIMKRLFLLSSLLIFTFYSFGQDKHDIIEKGIKSKKNLEINYADGDKTASIEKEEFYNSAGEIIEIKEYKEKGKTLVLWFKYKYDANSFLIEELELNSKGEQKERIEYKYVNGLRVEKLYYDSKNRLSKKKTFEYEFRK